MIGLDRWLRDLRRAVAWRRRLLTAGLLAGSMAFALQALAPSAPAGAQVVVATRDVSSGATLQGGDLRLESRLRSSVPTGALTSLASARGRPVTAAVRRGEVLTDVRLAGPSALTGLDPTMVAVTVRVADPEAAALVRVGDLVDILGAGLALASSRGASTSPTSQTSQTGRVGTGVQLGQEVPVGAARTVATDVRVLSIPALGSGLSSRFGTGLGAGRSSPAAADGSSGGTVLVVATTGTNAASLAAAAVSERLSLVLRHD